MLRHPLAMVTMFLLLGVQATFAQPIVPAHAGPVTAAGLVVRLRESEAWFVNAKSLSLTSSMYVERTPEQLAKRANDIGPLRGQPSIVLRTVFPWAKGTTKLAFDQKRFFHIEASSYGPIPGITEFPDELRFIASDGKSVLSGRPETTGINYRRSIEGAQPGSSVNTGIWWPCLSIPAPAHASRVRPMLTSLTTFGLAHFEKIEEIAAEDFTLNGTAVFEGTNCYIVRSPLFGHRLFVSTKDQTLIGVQIRGIPVSKAEAERTASNVIRNSFSIAPASTTNIFEWYLKQPAGTRKRVAAEFQKRLASLCVTAAEVHFSEHQEVQPGCWIPGTAAMRQWAATKTGEVYLYSLLTSHLNDIAVDQNLPDSAFEPPTVDGTTVLDTRFEAHVRYPYRKEMKDEEVRGLVKEASSRAGRSTTAPARRSSGGAVR